MTVDPSADTARTNARSRPAPATAEPSASIVDRVQKLVDERGAMAVRYLLVSCFNVVGHQALLYLANSEWGWTGGWANAFAACVMAGPAFLLSRHWVWEVEGEHDLRREVLPFWALTIAGLVTSTLFATGAQAAFGSGLPVNIASLAGYFIVWVGKFFLLDKIFTPNA